MSNELDIEATSKVFQFGILVFNENGKKLYYRPKRLTIEESEKLTIKGQPIVEFELVPLTSEEKKQYGIIEESAQTDGSEIDIEESEQSETEEEKAKKKNLTLTGSPEAVKAARSILEREMQKRNLGENSESDDLASMKLRMYEKFNKNPMFLDATSKSQLSAMVENFVNSTVTENQELKRGIPAGSPLVQQQYDSRPQEELWTKKFEGATKEEAYKNMVDELFKLARNGSKEAQSYIDELERNWLTGKRLNPKTDETFNPNVKEALPALKPVEGTSALTPIHRDEGDIAKILHSWKLQRERKMKEGSEQ